MQLGMALLRAAAGAHPALVWAAFWALTALHVWANVRAMRCLCIARLNQARAAWIKPDAIIMHPGPMNRGVEIDSALADSDRSVILQQVTNGIAVRMAVLYLCAGGQPEHVAPVE